VISPHRIHFLLLATLAFCSGIAPTSGAPNSKPANSAAPFGVMQQGTQASATHTPTKLALLIGIDDYEYKDRVSPLQGSINDVEDMKQVLIGKFEFLPENVMVLENSQATHAGIIDAIKSHLIARAHAGDIVLLHYSGHGSEMPSGGANRISGLEQTIVPYDSRDPEGKVFDIGGAELHPLLVELAQKTKNVTFILDSCHSGTLVRGARVRSIPADTRIPPAQSSDATRDLRGIGTGKEDAIPKFVAISAATSRESAFEHFAEGKDHGALTYFLTRQLRSAKAGATYRDVMDSVIGNVTANYPAQHPSLEGAEADQFVFGDGSSLSRAYVTASPSLLDSHRVTIGAGQVQGATVGSTYDVYPAGSKKFAPPENVVAKVQLVSVGAFSSEAALISGVKPAPASRAVERAHQYGTSRMRVLLDGAEQSTALQAIAQQLKAIPNIEVVDKAALCNLQLKEDAGKIHILAADSTTLSTPVSATDTEATNKVVAKVRAWMKWFGVLSIRNAHPDIELQFTLQGSETRDPMARIGRPDMGVKEGETVVATLKNDSERDVYVSILDLSSDGSISVVYPVEQGLQAVLKPGSKLTRSLTTFVPKGRRFVTDILKVFGSYKPIDLSPLTQGGIRGANSDPLADVLTDAAGETRGVSALGTKPVDLGSWTSVQRVLVVKRSAP